MMKTKIEDFIKKIMLDWNIPDLFITIIKDNEVFLNKGYSLSQKKHTSSSLFRIGSITKSITSLAIAIFVKEYNLDLDTPLINYLPEFEVDSDFHTKNITIRDILSHRSGIPYEDNFIKTREITNRHELLKLLKYFKPIKGLREGFIYNNLMYGILGYLVENITKITFEEYVEEKVLKPLGMHNTFFSIEKAFKTNNLIQPYIIDDNGNSIPRNDYLSKKTDFLNPAGGLISCGKDMAKWIKYHISMDGSPKLIDEMTYYDLHYPQVIIPKRHLFKDFGYFHYALGWHSGSYKNEYAIWHGGHVQYSAEIFILPKCNFGVNIMCNMESVPVGQILTSYLADIFFNNEVTDYNSKFIKQRENIDKRKAELLDKRSQNRERGTVLKYDPILYAGTYSNSIFGRIEIVTIAKDLFILIKNEKYKLQHYHYDIFEFNHIDSNGRKSLIEISFNSDGGEVISASIVFNLVNGNEVKFIKKPNEIL